MVMSHDVEAAVVVVVPGRGRLGGRGHSVVTVLVGGVGALLGLQIEAAPRRCWRGSLNRVSESCTVVLARFGSGKG